MTKSPQSRAPEERRSAAAMIADAIRDGILGGRFAPGQRLVEADITAEFGVSRGPVRDAFGRLAAEGLLEILTYRGARVKQYTAAEIVHLFEVREVLEGFAARGAARNCKPGRPLRNHIITLHRSMGAAVKAGRIRDFSRLNKNFHDAVLEAAGNPILTPLVLQLQIQALRTVFQSSMDLDMLRRSSAQHDLIVERILAGDEDGAEAAMRAHIRAAREQLAGAAPAEA